MTLHTQYVRSGKKCFADESATASTTAAEPEAACTPDDSFCQLVGANLGRDTQCLDDWRLQLLELLPAAGIQLTEAQVCSIVAFSVIWAFFHLRLASSVQQAARLNASI